MGTYNTRITMLIVSLLLFGSHATAMSSTQKPKVYAYTLLVPSNKGETLPLARVVIDQANAKCPELVGNNKIETQLRNNPSKDKFPVTVCEAFIPYGEKFKVDSANKITLDAVTQSPSRVLIYGDSGCKSKDCKKGKKAKPFNTLASQGADEAADLILHMGDFNYRGTGGSIPFNGTPFAVYDAGDDAPSDKQCQLDKPYYSQNASDSTVPDQWSYWRDDFFKPAKDLLPKAPWVVARGNHELCSRAGPGWFYFMGPGSSLPQAGMAQMSCPAQGSLGNPDSNVMSHLNFIAPYHVELDTLNVVVMDSANACDAFAPNKTTTIYKKQFETVSGFIAQDKQNWFITHRPMWGIKKFQADNDEVETITDTLQQAVSNSLPEGIDLLLAGHMHIYQALTFEGDEMPPQLVVGNSGVKLANAKNIPATIPKVTLPGGIDLSNGMVIKKHGYMIMELDGEGWKGKLKSKKGKILAECGSDKSPVCSD